MFKMSLTFDDAQFVVNAVNQGIDGRLEAFAKSKFSWVEHFGVNRLECEIHEDEMSILLRRLCEMDETWWVDENSDDSPGQLAEDIVSIHYGY